MGQCHSLRLNDVLLKGVHLLEWKLIFFFLFNRIKNWKVRKNERIIFYTNLQFLIFSRWEENKIERYYIDDLTISSIQIIKNNSVQGYKNFRQDTLFSFHFSIYQTFRVKNINLFFPHSYFSFFYLHNFFPSLFYPPHHQNHNAKSSKNWFFFFV